MMASPLGEVAERLNALVSKTSSPSGGSGVRIPPSPLSFFVCRDASLSVPRYEADSRGVVRVRVILRRVAPARDAV